MTTLSMSRTEREEFLAAVHVGVLAVSRGDDAPLVTPVWYRYADGVIEISTTASTRKVALLRERPQATLCVQRESDPPAYVTVEGEVTVEALPDGVVADIASRYLAPDAAAAYTATTVDNTLLRFHIQRWRTTDYAKLSD